jgi:hypothetical protein
VSLSWILICILLTVTVNLDHASSPMSLAASQGFCLLCTFVCCHMLCCFDEGSAHTFLAARL